MTRHNRHEGRHISISVKTDASNDGLMGLVIICVIGVAVFLFAYYVLIPLMGLVMLVASALFGVLMAKGKGLPKKLDEPLLEQRLNATLKKNSSSNTTMKDVRIGTQIAFGFLIAAGSLMTAVLLGYATNSAYHLFPLNYIGAAVVMMSVAVVMTMIWSLKYHLALRKDRPLLLRLAPLPWRIGGIAFVLYPVGIIAVKLGIWS